MTTVASATAGAAELIMFERPGCPYCLAFEREVGAIYASTDEGRRIPLRRVDITGPTPGDLSHIRVERFVPVFVLVDQGREIGRIRGYAGEVQFWGLLDGLIARLPEQSAMDPEPGQVPPQPKP
jgi:hypothetical protein